METGDLFVIRVAGNVLDNHEIGSIEYAAGRLKCKEIIVPGHTECGYYQYTLWYSLAINGCNNRQKMK